MQVVWQFSAIKQEFKDPKTTKAPFDAPSTDTIDSKRSTKMSSQFPNGIQDSESPAAPERPTADEAAQLPPGYLSLAIANFVYRNAGEAELHTVFDNQLRRLTSDNPTLYWQCRALAAEPLVQEHYTVREGDVRVPDAALEIEDWQDAWALRLEFERYRGGR